jgi:antitoxin component of MazEF toxin-antitoxin module
VPDSQFVELRNRNQLTLPRNVVTQLSLKEGDQLELELQPDGSILLVPQISVPKSQAWFWSPDWQTKEALVDSQMREKGPGKKYNSSEEALKAILDADD